MAVEISNGLSLASHFGLSKSALEKMHQLGVTVDKTGVGIYAIKQGDMTLGLVSIKAQAISLVKSGQLGPASKEAIKLQFEAAFAKANHGDTEYVNTAEGPIPIQPVKINLGGSSFDPATGKVSMEMTSDPDDDFMPSGKPKLAKNMLGTGKVHIGGKEFGGLGELSKEEDDYLKEGASYEGMSDKPKGAIPTMDTVKLASATQLYQPVTATSAGSVYHVIALLVGCNVSMRFKGKKLSFRAEGPALSDYAPALKDCGFAAGGDYMSVHFEVPDGDTWLVAKTVGAIVSRVGPHKVKQWGDVQVLLNKGV